MSERIYYRGKALVVGNDLYDQMKPDLDNAVNDAKGIYETFRELGFMMIPEAYNIGFEQFDRLFDDFKSDLKHYEVGVLYFSGHGVEINGKNYLIMKNTPMGDLAKSTTRLSIDLQECLKELHDTHCKMIIVIIDACRNNPFEGKERGWGSVNLAPLFAPKGTLLAYSTSPGETALDFGMDGHSVYTGALLKHLKEEGLEVETFFKKVRSTVDAMTEGKQTSWEHTSLIGSFSFNSGKMVHINDIGYETTVIRDSQYNIGDDKVVAPIIKKLKSYNWYEQNDGVKEFLRIRPEVLNRNQLFIIGRNLLQSSFGGARSAHSLIIDEEELVKYSIAGENHLLNGILFEIYFNSKGLFRYKNFKMNDLDDLMKHSRNSVLQSSFTFIQNALKEFVQFLIFVPSITPSKATIHVKLIKEKVNTYCDEPVEFLVVKSIYFEGNELLAKEEESNVFPPYIEPHIRKDDMEKLLCDGYGIPSSYLDVIYNEHPQERFLWLDRKFRRFFRGSDED